MDPVRNIVVLRMYVCVCVSVRTCARRERYSVYQHRNIGSTGGKVESCNHQWYVVVTRFLRLVRLIRLVRLVSHAEMGHGWALGFHAWFGDFHNVLIKPSWRSVSGGLPAGTEGRWQTPDALPYGCVHTYST